MRCDEFRRHLADYLRGRVEEPLFGEMADHEAECAGCQTIACAVQAEDEAAVTPAPVIAPGSLLDSVLAGTTGGDCQYMEQRLSERSCDPLGQAAEARLQAHLETCASCRRLRDVLEELPTYYAAVSDLKAGREFTYSVMRRTAGREPGFFEVVRALLRRPEAIWEATVACAFVSMLVFRPLPSGSGSPGPAAPVSAIEAGLRGANGLLYEGIDGVHQRAAGWSEDGVQAARSAWSRLLREMSGASGWMERTGDDLRSGNTGGLMLDLDAVLQSLHLHNPKPAARPPLPENRP